MKSKPTITWSEYCTPPELCEERRGNRSTVACEKPLSLDHDEHAGRGCDGRWFFWHSNLITTEGNYYG